MIGSLDTHESVKSLTAAGFTDAQAEALTAVVKAAVDIDLTNIATRTDIADLRGDLSTEVANLRGDLSTEAANLRREISTEVTDLRRDLSTEVANLRREITQLELRLIKWVIGTGITATLVVGGMLWTAVQVLLRAFPHS